MFDKRNCFCGGNCAADPAIKLIQTGETEKALPLAREAVLKAPNCPFAHGILGNILSNSGAALYAEGHIRASKLLGDFPAQADTNLGYCFINGGHIVAAERAFQSALMSNPNMVPAHAGLAKCAELNQEYEKARALCEQAWAIDPNVYGLRVTYAKILSHFGEYEKAINEVLAQGDCLAIFERGKIREKQGDFPGAWSDYATANKMTGKHYDSDQASMRIANHRYFWGAERFSHLPRLSNQIGQPVTPLFITGFPRSGTTLMETMLSAHSKIHPGDELKFLHDLASMAQSWLMSQRPYPICIEEFMIGDKGAHLRAMKAYYTQKAMDIHDQGKPFITDKMPLNEMHLPFITMLFPESPILYMRRHPLDIVVSNFSTYLSHGFNQSFDLVSSATHYARVDGLLSHYKNRIEMNYRETRYETLVDDPRKELEAVSEFIGIGFEEPTIKPEENKHHPRTPSYEAVRNPVNSKAVGRWKNFEPYLGEAVRLLEPIIKREGD